MVQFQQQTLQLDSTLPLQSLQEAREITHLLQTTTEVFQEMFGINQGLLLLLDASGKKVCYADLPNESINSRELIPDPNLLTLCCQLIEKNQSLLLQRKLILWRQEEEKELHREEYSPQSYQSPSSELVGNHPQALPLISKERMTLNNLAQQAQVYSLLIIPLFYQQSPQSETSSRPQSKTSYKPPCGINSQPQSYLGELCLFHLHSEHQWTEKELTLVRHLSNQCALNIYYIEQLHHQSWQKQLLKQINEKLNSKEEPETVLGELLKLVGENFQLEQVFLLSLEGDYLKVKREWTNKEKNFSLVDKQIALDEWIALLDISSCQGQEQNNNSHNWQYKPTVQSIFLNLETTAIQSGVLASIPIRIRENFFGVLLLQTSQITFCFTPENLETLDEIAQQTAMAIHNLQHQAHWITQEIEKLELQKQHLELAKKKTSEFLDHTIHELRSPLTGILSFSQILYEQIYGPLNSKQNQYIDVIVASGKHMLSLVNDFLDLSKIEANREEIVLEAMAVEDVCLASLALVDARAQEAGLTLILDIAADVDFCKADQRRIKQILVNLLSNAIKFTEVGSVTLKVQRRQDYLEFSVLDTGIGIKIEDQNKLFQPFQQIKNHLSRKHKGTGLGLALSRQLAQLHGGDITLVSEEGQGSCFTLHLPT